MHTRGYKTNLRPTDDDDDDEIAPFTVRWKTIVCVAQFSDSGEI